VLYAGILRNVAHHKYTAAIMINGIFTSVQEPWILKFSGCRLLRLNVVGYTRGVKLSQSSGRIEKCGAFYGPNRSFIIQ
jgi:hypothetical protein